MINFDITQCRALPVGPDRYYAYNALDCTGTREVADVLLPRLERNDLAARIYAFERALQGPALSMMLRGVRVDQYQRSELSRAAQRALTKAENDIAKNEVVQAVWDGEELETGMCTVAIGKRHKWPRGVPDSPERRCDNCGISRVRHVPYSPNSSAQTDHLFYDLLGLPVMKNKTGNRSTDEMVLERMKHAHPKYADLIDAILVVRDQRKQLGSLNARLTADGRYPSSFNVGAAWTGRFSSSKAPMGHGGNLQNVAPMHRRAFIADPGFEMGYADYMQGESNLVAHLSGDERYIEAHRIGDVHTYVCRYLWPELPWTGDLKKDKAVAKRNPPWAPAQGHDYRFQCKRIQHGSNYGLTPHGISRIAKIPFAAAKAAYENYMTEFDRIPAWQAAIAGEVEKGNRLINPLGRPVELFGRPWDLHTKRQGYAFLPQSSLADILNIALYRTWWDLEPEGVQLLAQVHDAMLFQYPRGELALYRELLRRMHIPVPVTDFTGTTRIMTIGVEGSTGMNWGKRDKTNPRGQDEEPVSAYMRENPL